jgi:hypothetical protein
MCDLDHWNDTVAHGMIPVCMEFMHVLLQRPVHTACMQCKQVLLKIRSFWGEMS